MKFDMHKCWRHVRSSDVFFSVKSVSFDDNGKDAILHGHWCTQAIHQWFFIGVPTARIKVTPVEYDNWKPYEPVGRIKL